MWLRQTGPEHIISISLVMKSQFSICRAGKRDGIETFEYLASHAIRRP